MTQAQLIDGKAIAALQRTEIARKVAQLRDRGLIPGLAVVLVGNNPASEIYVRNKGKMARAAGMESIERRLPADTDEQTVLNEVTALNADPSVHGILVQMPLPPQISADRIIGAIHPDKDVDGLTPVNAGRLVLGQPGHRPCTPAGSVKLIKHVHGEKLDGLRAVVIGRSILVGKPLGLLLLAENCTVTYAHSRTRDLKALAREADILCAATGRPEFITGDWIKPGATVIDIGITRLPPEEGQDKGRIVGDVDFAEAVTVAGAITPVPGGVGPMTIAGLLENTVHAAARIGGAAAPPSAPLP